MDERRTQGAANGQNFKVEKVFAPSEMLKDKNLCLKKLFTTKPITTGISGWINRYRNSKKIRNN